MPGLDISRKHQETLVELLLPEFDDDQTKRLTSSSKRFFRAIKDVEESEGPQQMTEEEEVEYMRELATQEVEFDEDDE